MFYGGPFIKVSTLGWNVQAMIHFHKGTLVGLHTPYFVRCSSTLFAANLQEIPISPYCSSARQRRCQPLQTVGASERFNARLVTRPAKSSLQIW